MKFIVIIALAVTCATAYSLNSDEGFKIEPASFDAYRDVKLLLSTRRNPKNPFRLSFRNLENVRSSPFDPAKPTRVLVHGWMEDDSSDISTATSEELLKYYDFNIIFVDWSEGSRTINYAGAANRVETVGRFVGSQLNWMRENRLINFVTTHVIGFSLGAHIAGFVGKTTSGQLNTIIGLDPAGPLFFERRPDGRINTGDARYVECLHTNGSPLGASAGIGRAICDADFFANGGESQRGCLTNTCSHNRAVTYYVESIIGNGFHSIRCQTERQARNENCASGGGVWFGNTGNSARNLRGIFHFSTNRRSPFALGPVRP